MLRLKINSTNKGTQQCNVCLIRADLEEKTLGIDLEMTS